MELDFDTAEEISDYVSIPAGTYLCRVADVRQGSTRNGDERWSVRLVVAEGEYTGRQAAWDNLVFSIRGRARVRKVLGALGLPTRGKVSLEPEHLQGLLAFVDVRPVEYASSTGEIIKRNEVPYDGYKPVPGVSANGVPGSRPGEGAASSSAAVGTGAGAAATDAEEDDDVPF